MTIHKSDFLVTVKNTLKFSSTSLLVLIPLSVEAGKMQSLFLVGITEPVERLISMFVLFLELHSHPIWNSL